MSTLAFYVLIECAEVAVAVAAAYQVTRSFFLQYLFAVTFTRACTRLAMLARRTPE